MQPVDSSCGHAYSLTTTPCMSDREGVCFCRENVRRVQSSSRFGELNPNRCAIARVWFCQSAERWRRSPCTPHLAHGNAVIDRMRRGRVSRTVYRSPGSRMPGSSDAMPFKLMAGGSFKTLHFAYEPRCRGSWVVLLCFSPAKNHTIILVREHELRWRYLQHASLCRCAASCSRSGETQPRGPHIAEW